LLLSPSRLASTGMLVSNSFSCSLSFSSVSCASSWCAWNTTDISCTICYVKTYFLHPERQKAEHDRAYPHVGRLLLGCQPHLSPALVERSQGWRQLTRKRFHFLCRCEKCNGFLPPSIVHHSLCSKANLPSCLQHERPGETELGTVSTTEQGCHC